MMTQLTPTGTLRRLMEGPAEASDLEARVAALAGVVHHYQLQSGLVWTALHIARLQADLDDDQLFDTVLLITIALIARTEGSTCIPLLPASDYIESRVAGLLQVGACPTSGDDKDAAATVTRRLKSLINGPVLGTILAGPGSYAPLIRTGESVYVEQTHRTERKLIGNLRPLLKRGDLTLDPAALERTLNEVALGAEYALNEEQIVAVRTCVRSRFSVISGGPGTGKTSAVIVSALRALVRMGVASHEIALAAPTGKAAMRMTQAINQGLDALKTPVAEVDLELCRGLTDAKTIHRLLTNVPHFDTFRHDRPNPLDARVVIIDEASMIDLELMNALIEAVPPDARLVLIGDPYQLPSVNTGAVFRDLVALQGNGIAGAKLTKSHRMREDKPAGREILTFANGINGTSKLVTAQPFESLAYDGLQLYSPPAVEPAEGEAPKLGDYDGQHLKEFLADWYARHLNLFQADTHLPHRSRTTFVEDAGGFTPDATSALERLFAHYGGTRILCLTQVYKSGARRINRHLHGLFRDAHGFTRDPRQQVQFYAGEPVMMLRNDYHLQVFNGDQGIVLYTRRPEEESAKKRVVFPTASGEFRSIDLGLIRDRIELSYAMTVHKSQGSEFKRVAIVLPPGDIPLLTREILYTGVTRASESVTLFGAPEMIPIAAARPTQRFTGIARGLAARELETPVE